MNSLFKRLLKDKLKYAYEWKLNDSLTFPRENPKSITSSWPTRRRQQSWGPPEVLKKAIEASGGLSAPQSPALPPFFP